MLWIYSLDPELEAERRRKELARIQYAIEQMEEEEMERTREQQEVIDES